MSRSSTSRMARDRNQDGETIERPSLALPFVFEVMRRRAGRGVLDLGPADGANIETFAALDCRLHVADLYRGLAASGVGQERDLSRFVEACRSMLPEAGAEPYDVILAWDVFDYLGPLQMAALMQLLLPVIRPGAHLFCLVSIHAQIAPRPLAYRILSPDLLAATGDHQASRSGPRNHQPDLLRAMPDFGVEKNFLLRHGVQEYWLRYNPKDNPKDLDPKNLDPAGDDLKDQGEP